MGNVLHKTLKDQLVGKQWQIRKWGFEFEAGDGRGTVHRQAQPTVCMLCSKVLAMEMANLLHSVWA